MEIDICARQINEIDTQHAVTLVLSGGAAVRIEGHFYLVESASAPATIDPENLPADRGLEATLVGRVVEAATADQETGSLSIAFVGGLVLTVPPDPDFEAWSASWSDGSMVIAVPGGGVSSWDARP